MLRGLQRPEKLQNARPNKLQMQPQTMLILTHQLALCIPYQSRYPVQALK